MRSDAQPTQLTAQPVLRLRTSPETAAHLAARPASVWLIISRFPTAQPVLQLQISPETAAHLAARRASVWLITSRSATVLHVVLALPEHLMSARHQAAKPESALPLTSTRRTVRHVLTRHLNVVSLLVARLEVASRITRLKNACRSRVYAWLLEG